MLTHRGDSLVGDVKPMLYGPEKKVQITGADRDKTTFSIFQVRAFTSEGETYHPVKGETGYVFMKLLKPGYLTLYAYQPENQQRFDGLLLKKRDGDNMTVPNLGFKKYMSGFLEDCPAVAGRISSGELGKKDLSEIIDAYNACVAGRTVDHEKVIAERVEQTSRIGKWDSLEEKIRAADFSEKNNALEMIAEVRKKIQQGEKIPNFLVTGLRNSLEDTGFGPDLEEAVSETAN